MTGLQVIRTMKGEDLAWVHALNTVHQEMLSPLTPTALVALVKSATFARVVEPDQAFLLAFDQSAAYQGVNFQWFRSRYERFVYVDRIAVDGKAQGKGLARHLYDDLFRTARAAGFPMITAEINSDPPNPGSDAFHEKLGFETAGKARLDDRDKTVRYVIRELA